MTATDVATPGSLRLAIASGKGGTGKTTLATSLAVVAARAGQRVAYLDCDVEEPNGHLFLRPRVAEKVDVAVSVPRVLPEACDGCGACAEFCEYSAIVCLAGKPVVFPELCHGCGGCALVCPQHAIVEEPRKIGVVERGHARGVGFVHGLLNVGEAMSPPVIRAVRRTAPAADCTIIDAPPGTSCPMMTTVRGCDFAILVTEPTPFGLNDLTLAVETMRKLGVPVGVVINRADVGNEDVAHYCRGEGVPVLLELADDRRIAEAYSRGELAVAAVPEIEQPLRRVLDRVRDMGVAAACEG